MKKYTYNQLKQGFIGLEFVIIATIMVFAGVVAVNAMMDNNDNAGNLINNGLITNVIDDTASGVDIVEDNIEIGLGSNASILLHWIYTPANTTTVVAPSSITWSVSPSNLVNIDNHGRMTANGTTGSGVVTLSVNVGGQVWTDTANIKVVQKTLRDYTIYKNGEAVSGTLDVTYTNVLTYLYLPWDATITSSSVSVTDPTVVSVSIDSLSKTISITPLKLGSTTMTVNINGIIKTVPLNVTFVPVVIRATAIDILDGGASVNWVSINGSKQLTIAIYPLDTTNQDAIISVGDPGIISATVNNNTHVITITQISVGTTTLTATVDGQSKTISVDATGTTLKEFNILKNSVVVSSDQINTATIYDIQFIPIEALGSTITATSSNTGIATVSVNNSTKKITVTPVTDGTATITVNVGGLSKTLTIWVSGIRVTTVNVKDGLANITKVTFIGTKTLGVEVLPATASNKTFTATIGNTSVATIVVDNNNKTITLTSVAVSGTTTLTVTSDGVSKVVTVKVEQVAFNSIDIRDGNVSVSSATVSASKPFNVVYNPSNATYNQSTMSITGYDATVITPSYDPGNKVLTVVPLKAGITTLTLNIGGVSDSLTVTVPAILASSISIQYGGVDITSDTIGSAKTYSVLTLPSGTTDKTITAVSSNPSIATVSVSGQNFTVTPVTDGITVITATNTASGETDTLTVNVTGLRVTAVNVKDGTIAVSSVSFNAVKTLNVEILPTTAINKIIAATVANTSIATVTIDNVNKTVTLTPVATGSTTLTVTVDGVSKVVTLTVTAIPVTGISISGSTSTLTGTRTLTAVITPSNASNKGVVWSTSNSSRITISSTTSTSITVTAVGNGSATITVRSAENSSISASITLNSDIGQSAGDLPLGSRIYSGGFIFQLVDTTIQYGLGYTRASNYAQPTTSYYTYIYRGSDTNMYDNTDNDDPEDHYPEMSIHTKANGSWLDSLPTNIKNALVGVSFPYAHYSTTMMWTFAPIAIPSVAELGFANWGSYPIKEGSAFELYATTPMSFATGVWTRTRTYDTSQGREPLMDMATVWNSGVSLSRASIYTSFEFHPVLNILNTIEVSYYKNASGYYVVR